MLPELGHLALILALVIATIQATLPMVGAARGYSSWMSLARPAVQLQFALVCLAFAGLAYAFVVSDFSLALVATHSNTQLPSHFRFAATWGSHEGSLLLWVFMLAAWSLAVSTFSRALSDVFVARVLAVLGIVSAGFLSFLLFTSNPYRRLVPAVLEGADLNPVLQDWGMVIHPPMLYMGYVGFAVAFAFALAALMGNATDGAWARAARPWALAAWCCLTIGIALGSWWAYRVLGWGGWWFWDPVENASFIPWLVGTALIHSLAMTDRRAAFRSWTLLLAISAFSLSLLGTFLVRSGVLNSVHTFANDPKRGLFMLAFLVLVVGGSLALFAWRAPRAAYGRRFDPISRETLLLGNNLILVVAAATVLLGTLYPLVLDAFDLGKISVGTPYFETVFVPLMCLLALLIGVGPSTPWKSANIGALARRLRWAFAGAAGLAVAIPMIDGRWSATVAAGLFLSIWIVLSSLAALLERAGGFDRGFAAGLAAQPRGYYGMLAAHCGLAIFIAGVTLVKGYEVERDVVMQVGDHVELGGYRFRFVGATPFVGPNHTGSRGAIDLLRGDEVIDTLYPEKRVFNAQRAMTTEAAVRSRPLGDLYVSLGEPLPGGAWTIRVYAKPFIGWIWGGCCVMAIGGLLALTDRRYRSRAATAPAIDAQAA